MALSTVPAGVATQALGCLREGGQVNLAQLARFLSGTLLFTGTGFDPPVALPGHGLHGTRDFLTERRTVAIVFYRAHAVAGNTAFIDALADAAGACGANARVVFCGSLVGGTGVRRACGAAPGQARHAGVAARQGTRAVRRVRARRGTG